MFEDARNVWRKIYYELSEEKESEIIENISARGPAQILKISLIYALASARNKISVEDLLAAKSIWNFSEKTAGKIFERNDGNLIATRIIDELTEGHFQLTRTEIRNLFNRNAKKKDIEGAKELLLSSGVIAVEKKGNKEIWSLSESSDLEGGGYDIRHLRH